MGAVRLDSAESATTSRKSWDDRVYRHGIDEVAKALRLWVRCKRGNRNLLSSFRSIARCVLSMNTGLIMNTGFIRGDQSRMTAEGDNRCRRRPGA